MLGPNALAVFLTFPILALSAKSRPKPESFELFGYNKDFGGAPLFYSGGYAYIGDSNELNVSDAVVVKFTPGSNQEWFASPNVTDTPTTLTNATFFVPDPNNSNRRVGFLDMNSTSIDTISTGFRMYGSLASLVADRKLVSLWTGLMVTERVHALYWNDTSLGQIPITLRDVAPSNPPPRKPQECGFTCNFGPN